MLSRNFKAFERIKLDHEDFTKSKVLEPPHIALVNTEHHKKVLLSILIVTLKDFIYAQ